MVRIELDPAKSAKNLEKHGLPLEKFADLDMDAAVIKQDTRHDYGEARYVAAAPLDGRLHIACFVIRGETYRAISLRKANQDESANMRKPLRPPKRPDELRRQMRRQMRRQLRPLTDEEGEVRELNREDFRDMKPVREVMPDLIEAVKAFKKMGRPKAETTKVHIGFRLAADVVESLKASGPGYNSRVEAALRKAGFGAKKAAANPPKPAKRRA